MLAQKVTLEFEKKVVVRLVGEHEGGPAIPVGSPPFVFHMMPPRPMLVDASLTCCRYVLAVVGERSGPVGQGWV